MIGSNPEGKTDSHVLIKPEKTGVLSGILTEEKPENSVKQNKTKYNTVRTFTSGGK